MYESGGGRLKLGKVVGSVVATRKDERLVGQKLMIVCELMLDKEGRFIPLYDGGCEVAVDLVGAGTGEIVLFSSGSSARHACSGDANSPVDLAIVGIVDQADVDKREIG